MITVSASTSAAELQAIIDSAPAGETILLGAGTFEFDRTVVINRDDITVMGTGSGRSKKEAEQGAAEQALAALIAGSR